MRLIEIHPVIEKYETFKAFAKAADLNEQDLIVTNEYLYKPFISDLELSCPVIYQEKYGGGEPTDLMIDAIMQDVKKIDFRRLIAIGGGTVIDISKVLVLEQIENVDELYINAARLRKKQELIIIPTTCGTGSEVTSISVINRTRISAKMGLNSAAMFADRAVLIPEFLQSLPYSVFASSSIDALIHAVESFLSPNSTPFTDLFSIAAIKIILEGYLKIRKNGFDARFDDSNSYLMASTYAGIAFSNAGVGAVHALSYAFGGKYHVAHGESNYQFFAEVLRTYYSKKPHGKIADLRNIMSNVLDSVGDPIEALAELLSIVLPLKPMHQYGATEEDIVSFARLTIDNQQRLLKNNYTDLGEDDLAGIFKNRL